jgi:hypothetical protein
VTTKRVRRKPSEILHDPGTKWVEVDVPHKFLQKSLFLTEDGLVTVPEKGTVTTVSLVEGHCIARQKLPHDPR